MKKLPTSLPDVYLIQPDVFIDSRGYFFESYNEEKFEAIGISNKFIQDNQSLSGKHVLRGLHFQNPPNAQGKLVRVIKGSVLDVAVDIRKSSPLFGKWFSQVLSESNKLMMWIPTGFAHGFLTLEDDTIFAYKCTEVYHKESEGMILWNDPDLAIDWGVESPEVSDRDTAAPLFNDFESLF